MYIEPNSNIRILNNVRLTPDYNHTIWFGVYGHEEQRAQQTQYFLGKTKYNLTRQYYQRQGKGTLKVNLRADDIYDCSYMMFQNTSYGERWFYAFITNVEYVANTVAQITYVLDVMQTWYFDYYIPPCYVEREHVADDTVFSNTLPEPLDIQMYKYTDLSIPPQFNQNYVIILAATWEWYGGLCVDANSGTYGGMWGGLIYNVFTSVSALEACLTFATSNNKLDGIVSLFMLPYGCVTERDTQETNSFTYSLPKKTSGAIDGYTPKNKKLYSAPFTTIHVENGEGLNAEYRQELFSTENTEFKFYTVMNCNPITVMYPLEYDGLVINRVEELSIKTYPQCSWNNDTFKAYLAQNTGQIIGSIASLGAGIIAGGLVGGFGSEVFNATLTRSGGSALQGLGKVYDQMTRANTPHGKGDASVGIATRKLGFHFYRRELRGEYAKEVDDFFTRYGYTCEEVKIPVSEYSTPVRENWVYVKTRECTPVGNMPSDDKDTIARIYNRGVTYWYDGDKIGDFSLSNNTL